MATFSYDVFLSHNRAQKDWTRDLARRLRDDGFNVWFDEFVLPKYAGKNWIDSLADGVEQSRKTALVWSPEFFAYEWPKFESNVLQLLDPVGDKGRILPIIHTHCDLPKRWAFIQGLKFNGCLPGTDEFEFHYHHLIHNLDNSMPYEGDFEIFVKQRPQQNGKRDQIPPASALPKGSRMPRASIGNFVGREKELRDLARSLIPGSTVGVHATVTGIGGVGKTQLAIEYAHRYGNRYPGGVFWLNMEKAEDAVTEVASCGGPEGMNLEGFSNRTAPEQAALVHQLWEESEAACLLIFDNAEEPEVVEKWRPKYGRCSVLITSRRDYWPQEMNVQSVPIESLPRPKSMELLEKVRPTLLKDKVEHKATDDLCDYLGDLPLALHVAASYLERYRNERVQDYLRDLQQASGNEPALEKVWSCFAVSHRKLKAENENDLLAMRLFQLAGYFAPASIARELLAETADLNLDDGKQRKQFNHAIARLQEFGLIAEEPDGRLILHRLLREFARQEQSPLSQSSAPERVAEVLVSFAKNENATGLPQRMSKERAHLRHAAMGVEELDPGLAGSLYNDLGYHAKSLALLKQAKSDYDKAFKLVKNTHGLDHPSVATIVSNIGLLLEAQGDLAGALEYIQRALQIDEKVYGPDHPNVAIDVSNIGAVVKVQGDLAGALEYIQRALQIDEKVYGLDHPNVAIRANNIGTILKAQGNLAGALEYTQRAIRIDERVYGPNHPNVAIRANNIGQILYDQGDLVGALEYTQRALQIDKNVYGTDHPSVAIIANNIGLILQAQGDLAGALEYMRRALQINERVYGSDHPNVAQDANNIAQILQAQGDLAGALEYMRRALAILEKAYGPENPTTKICANNFRAMQELIDQNKSE